jgi:hypothetical protein
MNKFHTMLTAGLLATLLVACAKPLPPDKSNYAGEWRGGPIHLVITPEGRAIYERKDGNMSKSIDAPVKEFKGDDFVVGVGFMSTQFAVSAPPHDEAGVWKMTVDGVELTRVAGGASEPVESPGSTTT